MNLDFPFGLETAERFDALYQFFSQKFRLKKINLDVLNRNFTLFIVHDMDDLLDELSKKPPDDIHITDERLPYWAEIWPSSLALSEYILQNLVFLPGTRILELGCGVGLTGMAAQIQGGNLLLTDYQSDALRLAELNWLLNLGLIPKTTLMDWREPDLAEKFPYILASDIIYEERFFKPLLDLFRKLLQPKGHVYLSEPKRPIAERFFQMILEQGFYFERNLLNVNFQKKEHQIYIYDVIFKQ
jgi:predicted nicotinamide N-methyase